MNPSITIVTVVYNASSTIPDCLNSVNGQRVPVGHFIVDGDSTDNTLDVVRQLSPNACIHSEPDNGIYDAMNKGIKLASGEIIGILNADDFYAGPDVLTRVAQVFKDPEVDCCYGDLVYIKETGVRRSARCNRENYQVFRYWRSGEFDPAKFCWGWMPPHPSFFVRRRVYEKYGLFNLDLGSAADYELMLRFLLRHKVKVAYIPEVLVYMRVGGVSNASWANRIKANHMDRKAWEVNGLKPYPWTTWIKPIRKIPQYFSKPKNFPILAITSY